MKKQFFMALWVFAAVALSGVAFAETAPSSCSPEVRKMQENNANAARARDAADAHEIIKQPDSTLALTCFDQSIAATSQLGTIFSDKPNPTPTVKGGGGMFGGLGGALGGLGGLSGQVTG